jgi:hypothetical protein
MGDPGLSTNSKTPPKAGQANKQISITIRFFVNNSLTLSSPDPKSPIPLRRICIKGTSESGEKTPSGWTIPNPKGNPQGVNIKTPGTASKYFKFSGGRTLWVTGGGAGVIGVRVSPD